MQCSTASHASCINSWKWHRNCVTPQDTVRSGALRFCCPAAQNCFSICDCKYATKCLFLCCAVLCCTAWPAITQLNVCPTWSFLFSATVTPGLPDFMSPLVDSQVGNKTITVREKIRTLYSGMFVIPIVALLVHVSIAKAFGIYKNQTNHIWCTMNFHF